MEKEKSKPQKKRKWRRRGKFFLYTFFATVIFLFCSFQFPNFFQKTWGRLFYLVPGRLQVEYLQFNFFSGHLQLRNARYQLPNGASLLQINNIDARGSWSSLWKFRLIFQHFNLEGFTLDLSSFPPSKKKSNVSEVFKNIMQRLGIEDSHFSNLKILLKNMNFEIPRAELQYVPALLKGDQLLLSLHNIQGELFSKPLSVSEMSYDGSFSFSSTLKKVLLFQEAKGQLKIRGAQLGKWQFSDLATEAKLEDEKISVENFELKIGETAFLLNVALAPIEQQAKGSLKTKGWISPNDIPGLGKRVAGSYEKLQAKLDFDLTGFLPKEMEGYVELQLQAKDNLYNKENPNLDILVKGPLVKGKLDLAQLKVSTEKTNIFTNKGSIDFRKMEISVPISGTGFDLRTFIAMLSDLEIYGYVDFNGTVTGSLKRPDFVFSAKAKETGYKFLRFGQNEGKFQIVDGTLGYVGNSPAEALYKTQVNIQAPFIFEEKRHTNLKSSFANLEARQLLENPEIKGKITGIFDLEVDHQKNLGKAKASIDDFFFYQFRLGATEMEGDLNSGVFSIPTMSIHPPTYQKMTLAKDTVFNFDPKGFHFKTNPLPGMHGEGEYFYERKNIFTARVDCKKCDLAPLVSALDFNPLEGDLSGSLEMNLVIGNFLASKMQSKVDRFSLKLGDESLEQTRPIKISYSQSAFHFDDAVLNFKQGNLVLGGSFKSDGPLDLSLKGSVDLAILSQFKTLVREAAGLAQVDLKITGNKKQPAVLGSLQFQNALLAPRVLGNPIENLEGKVIFEKDLLRFEKLKGSVLEGDLLVSGQVWHQDFKIQKSDVNIEAREIAVSEPGVYKIILSGKLGLTGNQDNLLLAGNLDITEGRYIKNFDIKDYILKPSTVSEPSKPSPISNLKLDLKIKSPGELAIKNNIAELYLKSDLHVTGTPMNPAYQGALEILDGSFHYFKLNFENAKGVIDFRDVRKSDPYVEIVAEKLFERPSQDIRVNARITGYTDNLQLSFTSDPPLEKREILALIFTGNLPEDKRSISGANLASSVLANQLTSVLEGPVGSYTSLDVFRLEASDPEAQSLTSLVVGKRVTDRLSLEFKTDLSLEESVKSVQAEYLLFDNLLLKGSRSTNGRYRLELTLRFKSY
ncbi:MAG: translocation/assembly module TamB domain-containing protein [Deltaproteobacteria bacterium]|nr:translocation/assembly module TamB domain-containing protein [Deltaproteobacteria bacterium]